MEANEKNILKLRLYKIPYIDPMFPYIVRLLFEGKFIEKNNIISDFYIYVWLDRLGDFKGFQAVLDNKITLVYHMSSKRSFGKLGQDIIDRGITNKESPDERKKIIGVINTTSNIEFTELFMKIKKLANGETLQEVKLNEKEQSVFSDICENQ